MDIIQKIKQFIKYWYVRYLLVTELYMVETWETIVVHVLLTVLFVLFWYFNCSITIRGVSHLRSAALLKEIHEYVS